MKNGRQSLQGLLIIIAMICLLATLATAQSITGDVVGTVTDSTGAIVPKATVTIKNVATNAARTVVTGDDGDYTFNLLPAGHYSLTVEAATFKTHKIADFSLLAGNRPRIDIKLEVATATENVEVTAAAPLLQSETSSVGSSIPETAVAELPLNGRNITNLITLQVGVTQGMPGNITSGTRPDDRRQTSSVSANGQREYLNANMLDGVDNNERFYGLGGIKPSIDAIQEVRVETNSFSAEIGRAGGAAVTVITKSGGNKLHGTLYEFFRNDVLNARDYFNTTDNPKSKWRQNQFGGSVSGPIKKDKAFFFFDIEQLYLRQGITSKQLVPSAADHATVAALPACTGPFFMGPPGGCTTPQGLAIFNLFPSANLVENGQSFYVSNPARKQDSKSIDAKVDYRFGQNDSMFARYSYNPVNSFFPPFFPAVNGVEAAGAGFIANGAFPGTNKTVAQGAQINYTHIFTPSLLMNLRLGFLRLNIDSEPIGQGTNGATKLGIPNGNIASDPRATGTPGFHFLNGMADLGDQIAYPIQNINNSYQVNGDVTYSVGKQSFKFGAALIRRQLNYLQEFTPQGWFFFPDPMWALNYPAVFVNRQNMYQREYLRSWEPSFYAQDDWRITHWLTLNLGLRYDIFTPFSEAKNKYANLDLNAAAKTGCNFNNTCPTIITGGTAGVKTYYGNFAPRFGFAAQIRDGLVLRGGFGLTYYPGDYAGAITLFNPPYNNPFGCSPIGGSCPAGTGELSQGPPLSPAFVDPNIIYDPNAGGLALVAKQRNFRAAYLEQFNLTLQKQFGENVLTVGYVGSLGRRQPMSGSSHANLPTPNANGTITLVGGEVPRKYASVLPGIHDIQLYENERTSNYNAMQASFERRFSKGLMMNANYTWAHGLNNWSGYESGGGPNEWAGNPQHDYGNSDLDVRHRLAVTATYELPFAKNLKGFAGAAFAKWNVATSSYWQTGLQFKVVTGNKPAGAYQDWNNSIRVNVVPGQQGVTGGISGWLNPAAFTQPVLTATTFTLGNERTNQYYGPHQRQIDLSLYKTFKPTEAVGLQFRVECFNISNTPNFDQPQHDIATADFGQILRTTQGSVPRVFQFGLKFSF